MISITLSIPPTATVPGLDLIEDSQAQIATMAEDRQRRF